MSIAKGHKGKRRVYSSFRLFRQMARPNVSQFFAIITFHLNTIFSETRTLTRQRHNGASVRNGAATTAQWQQSRVAVAGVGAQGQFSQWVGATTLDHDGRKCINVDISRHTLDHRYVARTMTKVTR